MLFCLQRNAPKPEPINFLKVLQSRTFKKFIGSFARELIPNREVAWRTLYLELIL